MNTEEVSQITLCLIYFLRNFYQTPPLFIFSHKQTELCELGLYSRKVKQNYFTKLLTYFQGFKIHICLFSILYFFVLKISH